MKFFCFILCAALVSMGLGCQEKNDAPPLNTTNESSAPRSESNTPPVTAISDDSLYPRQPQPRLQTIKLWLGTNEINAELALTPVQVMTGMMWRTNMAEMDGMLFVFGAPQQVGFWMKNTLLPLSCAYIDPEGVIQEIYPMEPLNTNGIQSTSHNIQYVLEMNRDWFSRHGVSTGAVIRSEYGALAETFIRR